MAGVGVVKRDYPKRGEVWVADLTPGRGWEVAKHRPVLIISNNIVNKASIFVIIIPISSRIPTALGFERILLPRDDSGLKKDSVAFLTQIRGADKSRLGKKVGKLGDEKLAEIEDTLKAILGLTSLE